MECVRGEAGPLLLASSAGDIQGESSDGVRRWLGVPFAEPPVGALRWRAPEPASCRGEVLLADTTPPRCAQRELPEERVLGEEDCLYLNIWAPDDEPPEEGWPVLFYIHGGGNIQGSASQTLPGGALLFEGSALARQGAIVVVTNYRLGVFGWLALTALNDESSDGVSGNWGLKDQQLALRWVRDHIEGVGGDPDRVLLFGESAGATNTIMHLAAPGSEGLFHAAAIMSGGVVATPLALVVQEGDALARESSCADDVDDASALRTCLRALSMEDLLADFPGAINIGSLDIGAGRGSNLGPVVDGVHLPERPIDAFRSGASHDVPVLFGTTAEEMAELLPTGGVRTAEDFETQVRRSFRMLVGDEGVARILETYPVSSYEDPAAALIAIYSDVRFVCPATRFGAALAEGQSAALYRYWFSRRSETRQGERPAAHGRELLYLFRTMTEIPFFTPVEEELIVSDAMMAAWVSFAATGVPDSPSGTSWDPWDPTVDNALEFNVPFGVIEGVRTDECQLWRELYDLD